MPALSTQIWQQLLDESPEKGAEFLVATHEGDFSKADRDVWDTWNVIVGGEPGRRPEATVNSAEAQFCVSLSREIVELKFKKKPAKVA